MAFTITVNHDDNHTLTFSKNILARRNEANVSVTVIVPAAVFALGSFAYIDFVLPYGSTYFKGDYDPSSGSFTFTLGSADTILSQDGRIGIQFVLRDSDVLPTIVWKSELKYALVGGSADATAQALTGIPAPATFPATFPAANVSIVDAGTYFASPDVEDALQEIGADIVANTTDIVALETATTAANLLTAIKTVDGAGSGLDADLLDAKSSLELCFTNVETAPDGITQPGIYTITTAFNGVLIHMNYDANYAVQIRHVSGGSVLEFRIKLSGAWGAWANI